MRKLTNEELQTVSGGAAPATPTLRQPGWRSALPGERVPDSPATGARRFQLPIGSFPFCPAAPTS